MKVKELLTLMEPTQLVSVYKDINTKLISTQPRYDLERYMADDLTECEITMIRSVAPSSLRIHIKEAEHDGNR